MIAAAHGDRDCLSAVAQMCVASIARDTPETEALCFAEAYARLAAQHGQSSDLLLLAGVLYYRANELHRRGDAKRADSYLAEADALRDHVTDLMQSDGLQFLIGALWAIADTGDLTAECRLNELIGAMAPSEAVSLCRVAA